MSSGSFDYVRECVGATTVGPEGCEGSRVWRERVREEDWTGMKGRSGRSNIR